MHLIDEQTQSVAYNIAVTRIFRHYNHLKTAIQKSNICKNSNIMSLFIRRRQYKKMCSIGYSFIRDSFNFFTICSLAHS